ncbi:hypothetical protein CHS0354_020289 [Potamilus streckersoni]|uniref:F5/8 type C domain-containing protein n=1 Tax=Potamilus streckersoni TaxID=2493646 RepID=A0AAE0VQ01_9BIVA|nr:hypothetical protein CHS0354_020289 [Potamilus streckersoni]
MDGNILLKATLVVAFCTAKETLGQSLTSLQQCAANIACSLDYQHIFQGQLDNLSSSLMNEILKERINTNTALIPMLRDVDMLKYNTTNQIDGMVRHIGTIDAELAHDREYLGNLTRGLYILNNEFHAEQVIRYQDVHRLVMELDGVKHNIAVLKSSLNQLLGLPANYTDPALHYCPEKDAQILELQHNLTKLNSQYLVAETASNNAQAIMFLLQKQVVDLKGNVSVLTNELDMKNKIIASLQIQLQIAKNNQGLPVSVGSCNTSLGMESGYIQDSAITASDIHQGYAASAARLNNKSGWYTSEKAQSQDWLQIDLGLPKYVSQVATQGAPCCEVMVTNYTLQYSLDNIVWKDYEEHCQIKYFPGNSDQTSVVVHTLSNPILSRFIRFVVKDFKKDGSSNYVGMRVELYGCSV